jgi:hypothetical protein
MKPSLTLAFIREITKRLGWLIVEYGVPVLPLYGSLEHLAGLREAQLKKRLALEDHQ